MMDSFSIYGITARKNKLTGFLTVIDRDADCVP